MLTRIRRGATNRRGVLVDGEIYADKTKKCFVLMMEGVAYEFTPDVSLSNVYYAIQDTETYYDDFYELNYREYADGTVSIYNTIQAAIDATMANRGDQVIVVGEWAITTPILLNKWGTTLRGATDWNNEMGGGNSNITCTGDAVSVINVTKAKTHIENLVLYMNGTGTTKGIEYSSAAPSQSLVRNVAIIKNDGDDAEGQGIKFTTVPTRSTFSNIFISGNTTGTKKLNQGILGASYSCLFKDITIGRTAYQAIYNVGSSNDKYEKITVLPSCSVGTEIGGVDAASSAMIDSRIMAATPGVSSLAISQCFTTGTTAYTGT